MFTLIDYIVIGLLGILGIFPIIGAYLKDRDDCSKYYITTGIASIITIIILVGTVLGISWYNTSTANGIRKVKDFQSNINNGIEREILITSEDGREIFYYEGKIDIESNHTDNYIKFESEEGKRYIIYYGIQDTILIKEK